MPDTMPLAVESLKGLVTPIAVELIAVFVWVAPMLAFVAFEAKLTEELPVLPIDSLPGFIYRLGMVLFMFATRAMRV